MVKHSQTIRRQVADELLECVYRFVGLVLKGVNSVFWQILPLISLCYVRFVKDFNLKNIPPYVVIDLYKFLQTNCTITYLRSDTWEYLDYNEAG